MEDKPNFCSLLRISELSSTPFGPNEPTNENQYTTIQESNNQNLEMKPSTKPQNPKPKLK